MVPLPVVVPPIEGNQPEGDHVSDTAHVAAPVTEGVVEENSATLTGFQGLGEHAGSQQVEAMEVSGLGASFYSSWSAVLKGVTI